MAHEIFDTSARYPRLHLVQSGDPPVANWRGIDSLGDCTRNAIFGMPKRARKQLLRELTELAERGCEQDTIDMNAIEKADEHFARYWEAKEKAWETRKRNRLKRLAEQYNGATAHEGA